MIQRVATLTDNILAKILICYTQTYDLFIIQLLVYVKYIVLIENYFSQPTYDNAILYKKVSMNLILFCVLLH